jgi:tRNA threonylcarbamoyladenosine biosynthesis protein TsaB
MGVRSSITLMLFLQGGTLKVSRHAAESGHKSLSAKRLQYIIHFLLLSMMMPLRATARILAFDTSTVRGSVAILQGRDVLAELRLHSPLTHSALLLKSIDFLLGRLHCTLKDLNLVAVGIGPGSFTGIRIGISTAMGISQSLGIPYAGISGFDALAHQVEFVNGRIGVVLDAHRSQVFYAEYIREKGRIRHSQKYSLIGVSDLECRLANRHLYIIGDLDACRLEQWNGSSSSWPRAISVDLFLAPAIGRLASIRKRIWRSGDYLVSEPMYIRPPDALRNKSRKR